MIIYEIKDKTVYKLTAAGSVLDLAVDAALLISHLYHAQASDELKEIFREKVTGMVNCGILWEENDMKSETPPSTLAFDLQMPGMDEFSERMEEQYWRRRHEEAEENGEEEEE